MGASLRQPVPGYAAPAEVTVEPGTRAVGALLATVAHGQARGLLRDDLPAPTTASSMHSPGWPTNSASN